MAHSISPIVYDVPPTSVFPLNPPSDYEQVGQYLWPGWAGITGDAEWAEFNVQTVSVFGISMSELTEGMAAHFVHAFDLLGLGGTPRAMRVFKRKIFDVQIPETLCSPSWIGIPGVFGTRLPHGCVSLPYGGTSLVEADEFKIQIIYQGSPAAVVLAATIAFLAVAIVIGLTLSATGVVHFPSNTGASIKDSIDKWSPKETVGGIAQVFILSAIAFGVIALVLPGVRQPSLDLSGNVGPVTIRSGQTGGVSSSPVPPGNSLAQRALLGDRVVLPPRSAPPPRSASRRP